MREKGQNIFTDEYLLRNAEGMSGNRNSHENRKTENATVIIAAGTIYR